MPEIGHTLDSTVSNDAQSKPSIVTPIQQVPPKESTSTSPESEQRQQHETTSYFYVMAGIVLGVSILVYILKSLFVNKIRV